MEIEAFYSKKGSLAHRPAAICKALDLCNETCYTEDKDAVDFCSPTGLKSDAEPIIPVSLAHGKCKRSDDCLQTQYCSMKEVISLCQCDTSTGLDVCTPVGTCSGLCDQYTDQIDQFNSKFNICMQTSDCTGLETCQTEEIAGCKYVSCTATRGVSISACTGLCVPPVRTPTQAQFTDNGNKIEVVLNFISVLINVNCGSIFDDSTVALLGPSSWCSAEGTALTIALRKGAAVMPGDVLSLKTKQESLIDIFGQSFEGSVAVLVCTNCTLPQAHITYPKVASKGCDGTYEDMIFDASYSKDFSGRGLSYAWSVDTSACFRVDSTTDFGASNSCTEIEDSIASNS